MSKHTHDEAVDIFFQAMMVMRPELKSLYGGSVNKSRVSSSKITDYKIRKSDRRTIDATKSRLSMINANDAMMTNTNDELQMSMINANDGMMTNTNDELFMSMLNANDGRMTNTNDELFMSMLNANDGIMTNTNDELFMPMINANDGTMTNTNDELCNVLTVKEFPKMNQDLKNLNGGSINKSRHSCSKITDNKIQKKGRQTIGVSKSSRMSKITNEDLNNVIKKFTEMNRPSRNLDGGPNNESRYNYSKIMDHPTEKSDRRSMVVSKRTKNQSKKDLF